MTQFRSIIVFRHWVGSEYEGRGRNGLCYNGRPRATVRVRGMCTKHQEPGVSRQGRLRKSETSTFYTKPEYIWFDLYLFKLRIKKKRSCLVFEKNKAPVSILLIPPSPQKKKKKEKRKRIWAVRLGVKLSTNSMKNNVFFLNSDRSHTPGWERRQWVCRGNRDPYGTDGQPGNGGRAGGMAPFHAIQNHCKRAL